MAGAKKRVLTPEEQTKAIVVEFADGPLGGRVLIHTPGDAVRFRGGCSSRRSGSAPAPASSGNSRGSPGATA